MLNLFDSYTLESKDLHSSLILSGIDNPTMIINDDGWLPDNVTSPIQYFLKKGGVKLVGKPLYFNQIKIPSFWEIKGDGLKAEIVDKDQVKGKISYYRQDNKRLVKSVSWYDKNGVTKVIDDYNQWGWINSRTTYNDDGSKNLTSYMYDNGIVFLTENYKTKTLIYQNPNGNIQMFENWPALVSYILIDGNFDVKKVLFNNLNISFFTSLQLGHHVEEKYLVWQELINDKIPGNMDFIINGHAGKTKIGFTNYESYIQAKSQIEPKYEIKYLGYVYPFTRRKNYKKNILVVTNSDQLIDISSLVKLLPEFNFKIAAGTEMSSVLNKIGNNLNVELYPSVSQEQLDKLYEESNLFLDINRGSEVFNAVRKAFDKQLLIIANKDTIHNRKYVSDDMIVMTGQLEKLVNMIRIIFKNDDSMNDALENQYRHADGSGVENYLNWFC
ncbi:accessory Sec system glycosylation chaperone GtfB [Limosilactobacillus equigenerosi]|uniref:UDP-N-acetylglucosamine--peptide N-acetylglucosaminyltransferase stabilizing protein GtfB n=1 Tax=Limosilactobacillus equigenerosi DSM 18793 = JCM 14505 TaxID=1423742 RepID=A0A0R1UFZ4_9LACO|nr:accessory Sec system glycosylation chaperone GtfB [Limosilactobacillus equigenerosi]KRL92295.1 accessory sec system glycosyltransferase gtfb [Limosilactobacillus equigenerosi DSM 18793 = JCM 14505]